MKSIGYIATTVLILALSVTYSGYALSVLWGWFVVALFELPELTVANAVGLSLIVTYLTQPFDTNSDEKSSSDVLINMATVGFIKPTFALLFGCIYVQFI